jgi:Fic family protein
MENILKFDQQTWFELLNKLSFIERYRGRWGLISRNENKCLELLQEKALVDSILSTMKLCGIEISKFDAEIMLKKPFASFDIKEQKKAVLYLERHNSVKYVISSFKLTEHYLFEEYHKLLGLKLKGSQRRSVYRNTREKATVESKRKKSISYSGLSAQKELEQELCEIIDWTNRSLKEKRIHPLLVIATFIYRFISIWPFKDANEQLSNHLMYLLLQNQEYNFVKFYSLESIIGQKKEEYEALKSRIWENRLKNENLLCEWILFFLGSIENLIIQLDDRYEFYLENLRYLNERQKELLEVIEQNEPVKFNDIAINMKKYSENTLKKDLHYLVKENYIEAHGKNKGTVYNSVS